MCPFTSLRCIFLQFIFPASASAGPSVVKVGSRLAVLKDAPGGDSISHLKRDVGLAWLNPPLTPPARSESRVTVASYYFGNYHPGDPRNEMTKGERPSMP